MKLEFNSVKELLQVAELLNAGIAASVAADTPPQVLEPEPVKPAAVAPAKPVKPEPVAPAKPVKPEPVAPAKPAAVPPQEPEKPVQVTTAPPWEETPQKPDKQYTLAELSAVMGRLMGDKGGTDKIINAMQALGVNTLGELDPARYPELVVELNKIGANL